MGKYRIRLQKASYVSFIVIVSVAMGIFCWIENKNMDMDKLVVPVSLFVVLIGTIMLVSVLAIYSRCHIEAVIILGGYVVRVVWAMLDIASVKLPFSGGDENGFYNQAVLQYNGSNIKGTSVYSYFISYVFRIFGNNRFVSHYVNIIFFIMTLYILYSLFNICKLSVNRRLLILVLWVCLPGSIAHTSMLLRESMMMFIDMLSFYYFLLWMKKGQKHHLVLGYALVAPAAILHSASVAVWVTYLCISAFWNVQKQKYCFMRNTGIVILVGIVAIILIIVTPLRNIFMSYVGDMSFYGITHRYHDPGSSDYLTGMDCTNWLQFIPYTLVRMIYFLFSPLPGNWRGIGDVFAFVTDGILLAFVFLYVFRQTRNRKVRGYLQAALLGVICFAGIFAWGVSNAGTAIRHRLLPWGILVMALVIALYEDGKTENPFGERQ